MELMYALESSFRFGGQPEADGRELPQSFAPVFWPTDATFGLFARKDDAHSSPCFTLGTWFSLSSPEQGVFQRGVLLGLQSEKCRKEGGRWPDFHCQHLASGYPHELVLPGGGSDAVQL